MKNRTWICLLCGLGSWGLFLLSMLTMNLSSRWIAYGLATLWIASSLAGVVLASVFRFRVGIRKDGYLRWGMIASALMLAIQVFVLLLSYFQQNFEWESSTVGGASFGASVAVMIVSAVVYRFLARKGQARIESLPREEKD
ncbi:MAG: hypothetical protein J6C26_02685 [Clostridia bacterium]|nr:hypothetical protein [Clostridia bacterium]MBQ4323945.1 hypothetical protein [Clostridia bacterium]